MAYTIVIASRYLIPLFLYLFLSCSIYALFVGDVRKQSGAAALQMVFLFLMQFTAWLTIVIRTQQSKYLLFYAFLQILTLALPVLAWFIYPGISRIVMNHMCMLFSAGLIVLTAFISPFRSERRMVRDLMAAGEFIEVFVNTPLEVAEERDVKGLYKKARSGQLKNFTGIDSPYEAPQTPEITVNTVDLTAEEAAERIVAALLAR